MCVYVCVCTNECKRPLDLLHFVANLWHTISEVNSVLVYWLCCTHWDGFMRLWFRCFLRPMTNSGSVFLIYCTVLSEYKQNNDVRLIYPANTHCSPAHLYRIVLVQCNGSAYNILDFYEYQWTMTQLSWITLSSCYSCKFFFLVCEE